MSDDGKAANSALKEAPQPGDGYVRDHAHAAHVAVLDAAAGVVAPSARKRIAICGFASSSRHLIPVNDPTWEVWGLNQLYRHIPRADRWFDIHRNWNEEVVPGTDYVGWIKECGIPFYMADPQPDLPTSVRFPIERLIAKFGVDYFTSTIAFMLALAIDEIDQKVEARLVAESVVALGVPEGDRPVVSEIPARVRQLYSEYEIGVFGVDLVVGEEYFDQKPCAEFWLGVASTGRGITVFLPPQSALCKQAYRYGYEKEPQSTVKLSELRAHAANLHREREQLMRELYMRDGALQADEYWGQLTELRQRGATVAG